MSTPPRDHLTDHEYDGIREYDNPCPGWWHLLFWATIAFSAVYFVFFTFYYEPPTVQVTYEGAVSENMRLQFAEIGTLSPDEPTLLKYIADARWITVGAQVFKGNCVSCHGSDGQGMVGPNLTDGFYKNVAVIADIPRIVSEGANNGAMPAWKTRLHPNELVLVSAYVASLRGRNLPGPRVAGDREIAPWPASAATPATPPAPAAPRGA